MATDAADRVMVSERVAPGMLPRVLNSFDMTIIFVAIVLFVVNSSAIQQAHQAAYTYWILGFLLFLIPGALVTSQLALPKDVCEAVYATDGYQQSTSNLSRVSLTSDMVFSDGVSLQTPSMTGNATSGYVSSLVVGVSDAV